MLYRRKVIVYRVYDITKIILSVFTVQDKIHEF
jgi:hypothetical protein